MALIYKIVPDSQWREAVGQGRFDGSAADLAGGYIHFSFADQLEATAEKYFRGEPDLLLIAVAAEKLDALRLEPSRGGALFPHLYGPLPLDAVAFVRSLDQRADGSHDIASALGSTAAARPEWT